MGSTVYTGHDNMTLLESLSVKIIIIIYWNFQGQKAEMWLSLRMDNTLSLTFEDYIFLKLLTDQKGLEFSENCFDCSNRIYRVTFHYNPFPEI